MPGLTNEVTVFGSNLGGVTSLWTSFEGTAEKVRSSEDRAVFKIALSIDCATGLGAVRLVSSNGISSLHLVMIDRLPSIVENGTSRSIATAQLLKMPVAVDGLLD